MSTDSDQSPYKARTSSLLETVPDSLRMLFKDLGAVMATMFIVIAVTGITLGGLLLMGTLTKQIPVFARPIGVDTVYSGYMVTPFKSGFPNLPQGDPVTILEYGHLPLVAQPGTHLDFVTSTLAGLPNLMPADGWVYLAGFILAVICEMVFVGLQYRILKLKRGERTSGLGIFNLNGMGWHVASFEGFVIFLEGLVCYLGYWVYQLKSTVDPDPNRLLATCIGVGLALIAIRLLLSIAPLMIVEQGKNNFQAAIHSVAKCAPHFPILFVLILGIYGLIWFATNLFHEAALLVLAPLSAILFALEYHSFYPQAPVLEADPSSSS